ncbi:unnamed protein product [Rotaria sp. Silwood1]|nr:unnamed protein product [Rotaria sp. Silwood1]
MSFNSECIQFYALTAEKLCVDLILGMDFMIAFHAIIDVHSQHFSIKIANQRVIIPVDDPLRRPLVPIHASQFTIIPPQSSVNVRISSPISSLSAYFIPTSTFLEHPSLSSSQTTIQIQHHSASLRVFNQSSIPQQLPRYFCFGYLLSNQVRQQNYFDQLATLCRCQNEKKNRQLSSCTVPPAQTPAVLPLPCMSIMRADTIPLPTHLQQNMDLLVKHLVDPHRQHQLSSLLIQYSKLFDNSRHNISDIVIHNVFNTVPHTPPASRPHRNPHTREETQHLIDEFLAAGLIQESNSPYAAPAFIVPRKDNRPGRLVVDYRALNKITIPDASPLPHGEDLLQELGKGYQYFSKLDLKSGYHQFRIPPSDRAKTAFVVSQGHYEFLVLSMGPQNAPAGFQKTMCQVMKPGREFCQVFLDDIILFSRTFDEHIRHLQLALGTLAAAKLVLNVSKCELAVEKVVVLGHTISATSITPTTDAIQAILDLPEPRTLKQANKFLGGLAYYRKFVPHFAALAEPIHKVTNLTKARRHLFQWTNEQSTAFHALKQVLTTAPLFLRFPVDGFPLQLATDASGIATGGVLFQDIHGQRHNLFYHSKVLSPVEQKYSVPEKEALAIFHCLQRMRTLILGRTVYIYTDHCPICGMLRKPVNNRRIERVANLIQEYQIAEMKHVDGKNNCLADYLSRTLTDPLFDIPYGLESKLTVANASTSSSFHQLDQISAMTLRPRPKQIQISTPVVPDLGSPSSDAVSICSSEASTLVSPPFTTAPSPNSFDVSALPHEQQRDPDLHRIFQQLTDRTASSSLTSSFIIKNNILHKLISRTPTSPRKLAVPYLPSSMVKSLLIATHDDPYQGGHFSVDKMFGSTKIGRKKIGRTIIGRRQLLDTKVGRYEN